MNLLTKLFESDYDKALRLAADMAKERTPENLYFKMGKETGYEQGFKAGVQKRILNSTELSQSEQIELEEFLINRDIELIYDGSINGMRARKTKFGWKDADVKYIHKK